MIEKELIEKLILEHIEGSDLFLVEVAVNTGNSIQVLVDSMEGAEWWLAEVTVIWAAQHYQSRSALG